MNSEMLFDEFYERFSKKSSVSLVEPYDFPFGTIYAKLVSYYEGEYDFFHKFISKSGDTILEIASGDGNRYSIPLAMEGYQVTGLECSLHMINECKKNISHLPKRIQKRITLIHKDFWDYELTTPIYDSAILPATTLCLFGNGKEQLSLFFDRVKKCIKKNGRFIFDYRIGPAIKGKSELIKCEITDENGVIYNVLCQDFYNYVEGWNIANFYADVKKDNRISAYSTYTLKKVFSREEIYEAIKKCDLIIEEKYSVKNDLGEFEVVCCQKR